MLDGTFVISGVAFGMAVALACTALTILAAWRGEQLAAMVRANRRELLRAQILLAEAERCRLNLKQLATAQQVSEVAVDFGANTVRAVHQGIAAIPFTILEAIPATRGPTRIVRALHDAIAGGVYDTITGVNQAVGSGLRRQLEVPAPPAAKDQPEPKP